MSYKTTLQDLIGRSQYGPELKDIATLLQILFAKVEELERSHEELSKDIARLKNNQ